MIVKKTLRNEFVELHIYEGFDLSVFSEFEFTLKLATGETIHKGTYNDMPDEFSIYTIDSKRTFKNDTIYFVTKQERYKLQV